MKRYFYALLMSTLALVLGACGSKNTAPKALVLYYSQTGATQTVAQELQKALNADIEAIELENPYTGTYAETLDRVGKERESGNLPKLKALKADLAKYDVVYLGYPIWFGTYALPIASLVKEQSFEGKKIVPFCTFGSGGLEPAMADLKKHLPKAQIADHGFGIRNARIASTAKELNRFLIEYGYLAGEVQALPGYSEMLPVTEEEKQIFDAACGDYQYPMGAPVKAGKRGTPEGVDYIFEVEGRMGTSTIYITVANGEKPEFTRVVR